MEAAGVCKEILGKGVKKTPVGFRDIGSVTGRVMPCRFFLSAVRHLLIIERLYKHFGGIRAVEDASLAIEQGSITGLIGPNGAGKTTLFNVIAGIYPPDKGKVLLNGEDITGRKPHELFAKGILRTFQIAHEFSSLSVGENLMMVPSRQSGESLFETWLRPKPVIAEETVIRLVSYKHLRAHDPVLDRGCPLLLEK